MIDFIYTNYEAFLWILTLTTVILNVFNWWYLSERKMHIAFPLSMAVYICYIVVETSLAFAHPEQISILLYNLTNVWAFSMSVKGYLKLKREENIKNM